MLIEDWHSSCIGLTDLYWHKDDINVICELLAVKHGDLELDLFNNSILDAFIEFCVLSYFLTSLNVFSYFICTYVRFS